MSSGSTEPPSHLPIHEPVLLDEVIRNLAVAPHGDYLDGTVGGGGHAEAILESSTPDGRLLALDLDPSAIQRAAARLSRFGSRVVLRRGSFSDLAPIADSAGLELFAGILLDLGWSSDQLEDARRGFSIMLDGPLDMRLDPDAPETAANLVNELPEEALADLIYQLGEEPRSRRIARGIVRARPIETTHELAAVVAGSAGYRGGRTHPATRTFQALRIAVNDELRRLEEGLDAAMQRLAPGARLAVISFHSLEDRLVKQAFRAASATCICPPELPECRCDHVPTMQIVTRRPVTAGTDEIARNPRARSAKLRVAERLLSAEELPR